MVIIFNFHILVVCRLVCNDQYSIAISGHDLFFNYKHVQVQSKIVWNSSNSSNTGYAMSSSDMASLHNVYEGIDDEEEYQKTEHMLQFIWRYLTSKFDVIGPYFTLDGSIDAPQLHSFVMKTLLVLINSNSVLEL